MDIGRLFLAQSICRGSTKPLLVEEKRHIVRYQIKLCLFSLWSLCDFQIYSSWYHIFDSFKSGATLLFSDEIVTARIEQDFPADTLKCLWNEIFAYFFIP